LAYSKLKAEDKGKYPWLSLSEFSSVDKDYKYATQGFIPGLRKEAAEKGDWDVTHGKETTRRKWCEAQRKVTAAGGVFATGTCSSRTAKVSTEESRYCSEASKQYWACDAISPGTWW